MSEKTRKYIAEHGGHAEILNIPINKKVKGWKKLENLQKLIKNSTRLVVAELPEWYREYLTNYEPNLKLKSASLSMVMKRPPQEDGSDSAPPAKTSRVEGVPIPIPKKFLNPTELLWDYIARNGGHSAIETMPIDETLVCAEKLRKLQENVKKSPNKDKMLYPTWYNNYLSKFEPDVKIHGTVARFAWRPRCDVPVQLARYIVENGGHSAIETMPLNYKVERMKMLGDLQRYIRKQRMAGNAVMYPKWYMQLISDVQGDDEFSKEPEAEEHPAVNRIHPRPRKIVSNNLISYLQNQGGHAKIETMPLCRDVKDWQMLDKLQHAIENQKSMGITEVKYPKWYMQYVALKEPDVQLPGPPMDPSQLEPDQLVIEVDKRDFTYDHIVNYVKQNGGNAAIETMPVDTSIEGWEKLADLQRRLRNPQIKGTIWLYPKWYKRYIAEHEPGVTLIGPDGPTVMNPKPTK